MTRRLAVPAMRIALANLAALGLLVGWVGASRAFSVGVHTLFRDHLPAVAITLAATAFLAIVLGRSLRTTRELALVIGFAVVADVAAAVAVTLVVDEMRRAFEIVIVRAIFTETVAGLQLLVIATGAAIGYLIRRDAAPHAEADRVGVGTRFPMKPRPARGTMRGRPVGGDEQEGRG